MPQIITFWLDNTALGQQLLSKKNRVEILKKSKDISYISTIVTLIFSPHLRNKLSTIRIKTICPCIHIMSSEPL